MPEQVFADKASLDKIISALNNVTVCAIGDICLDYYLYADMKLSNLSRETPHHPLPIVKEITSPGGGGNAVNNIKALGVKKLIPVSLIGNDWRGYLLEKYFNDNGFDTSFILKSDNYITTCYCKPMRMGISDVIYEDPRLDFENRNPLNNEDEDRIITALKSACIDADILVVSDQLRCGIITPKIRDVISEIAKRIPVIVDSRENAGCYTDVIIKPNEVEAAYLAGKKLSENFTIDEVEELANELRKKNGKPVIITLGDKGSLWSDETGTYLSPAIKAKAPIDIVGAGDTFLSAFSCAFAGGASGPEAIAFANLASRVTIKKIGTTGTAAPDEIISVFTENYNE